MASQLSSPQHRKEYVQCKMQILCQYSLCSMSILILDKETCDQQLEALSRDQYFSYVFLCFCQNMVIVWWSLSEWCPLDANLSRSDSTFLAHFKILKLYMSLPSPPESKKFGRELTVLVTSAQRGNSPHVTRQLHDKGKLRLRRGSKVSSRIMASHKSII